MTLVVGEALGLDVADYTDRLAYRLPPFLRMAWATSAARDHWATLIESAANQVRAGELMSVVEGLRPAALLSANADQATDIVDRWDRLGLAATPVGKEDLLRVRFLTGKEPSFGAGGGYWLVSRRQRRSDVACVWASGNVGEIAAVLGYPACCAARLQLVASRGDLETAWSMASDIARGDADHKLVELVTPSVTHPFLGALGLRAVPYRSCSFTCTVTDGLIPTYAALRTEAGGEGCGLAKILAWPIEWSLLHGIVEIKTATLTLCHEGDATASTYRVRLLGGSQPQGAAQGLRFPYTAARRRRRLNDS